MYEILSNFLIKNNLQFFGIIFFKFFKLFLKNKIILDFLTFKFYAYPQKKQLSRWMLKRLKIWDQENIEMILRQIKNQETIFIDIGCNYGAYSIPVAKIKNLINVYCFDPSKQALKQLKANIKLNNISNIKYFKLGIGDKKKTVYFDDIIKNYKNSGSFEIIQTKLGNKININSIDNLIKSKKILPCKNIIIKMDIEGYEFFAMQGLQKTINKYNIFILFEFSKKIFNNHRNLEILFSLFLKKNKLNLFDTKFSKVKIKDLCNRIKKLPKNHEVLGNYILTRCHKKIK